MPRLKYFNTTTNEWEYVGTGGGGGTAVAQSDWNAAEGEPGHVLNRTHWVESNGLVEILPETELSYDEAEQMFMIDFPINVEVGNSYLVTWNGVEYRSVVIDGATFGEPGTVALTNEDANMYTGEGAVYAVILFPANGIGIAFDMAGSTEVVIAIKGEDVTVHKLDMKFLPDGLPYSEICDSFTLKFDGNITDRTVVGIGNGIYFVNIYGDYIEPYNLLGGTLTCVGLSDDFLDGTISITEDVIQDATEMLGVSGYSIYDCCFVVSEEATFDGITVPKGINVICANGAGYVSELSAPTAVFADCEIIHKLDNKYLNLDWLPITENGATIIEKQFIENGYQLNVNNYTFIEGQSVVAEFDGVRYECIISNTDDNYKYFGNRGLLSSSVQNTGEPFIVFISPSDTLTIYFINGGSCYFALYDLSQPGVIYNKLPNEFMPIHTHEIGVATDRKDGLMSADDKAKLDTVERYAKPYNFFGNISLHNSNNTYKLSPEYSNQTLYINLGGGFEITDTSTTITKDHFTLNNLAAGMKVEGKEFTVNGETVVAEKGAEIYNCYGDDGRIGNKATGYASHAEGYTTVASGNYSHAEGYGTIASGSHSHAEGGHTIASGMYSHAEGYGYTRRRYFTGDPGVTTYKLDTVDEIEIGYCITNIGSGADSGVLAKILSIDRENLTVTLDKTLSQNVAIDNQWYDICTPGASGEASHAEGVGTTASGTQSHAEGRETVASGWYSHAEGYETTASSNSSHAEGYTTVASGSYSHAEGHSTVASGFSSHAEGQITVASGWYSHAEGCSTTASGDYSHAEGYGTIASGYQQHVQGSYNIEDNRAIYDKKRYIHIVGNGESDTNRSNAHTLDFQGNAWFAGDVKVGGTGLDDPNAKRLLTEDDSGADWNAKEGESGYIRNKPFGGEEIVLAETIIDVDRAVELDTYIPLDVNKKYIVTVNGTDYSNVSLTNTENVSMFVYSETNETILWVTSSEDQLKTDVTVIASDVVGTLGDKCTISIRGNELVKIDKKYLPDDVATKEYVNIRVPAWTEADEGKFLRIVNGVPAWTTVPSAEESSF